MNSLSNGKFACQDQSILRNCYIFTIGQKQLLEVARVEVPLYKKSSYREVHISTLFIAAPG
jgi:hypothetical protein